MKVYIISGVTDDSVRGLPVLAFASKERAEEMVTILHAHQSVSKYDIHELTIGDLDETTP